MKRSLLLFSVVAFSLMAAAQVPRSKHVYVLALENTSYEHLVGSSNMPYMNSLIKKGALATQFYANKHNSIVDYFLLTSGQIPTTNNSTTSTYDVDNMVRHTMLLGKSYKVYAQALPYAGYAGVVSGAYLKRHTALPYYTDMGNSSTQMQKLESVSHLTSDIQNGTLPNFGFIVPDMYHDLHSCPNGEATCQKMADAFMQSYLAPLLASPAFQPGGDGLLIIWSDEADLSIDSRCNSTVSSGCGGRVVVAMIGPKVRAGYKSTINYHHQHLLKTMLMALGTTSNFPGLSSTAAPMSDFFVSSATPLAPMAGIVLQSPTPGSTVGSPVHVVASSTQSNITGTRIYVDGTSRYSTTSTKVDTYLSMSAGTHYIVAKNWNSSGATTQASAKVTVK